MKNFPIRFVVALLSVGALWSAAAQSRTPVVTARVEPDSIGIGDRFDYIIEVEKDLVQVVRFPVYESDDTKIELVEDAPVDTLLREGRQLKLRKRYRLAAFEEGRYNLGRAQVLYADKNIVDTLWSAGDSLRLEVGTFLIDSTSQSIYDIKPQKTLPFRFGEISGSLSFFWCSALRSTDWCVGCRPAANASATCSVRHRPNRPMWWPFVHSKRSITRNSGRITATNNTIRG